MSKLYIEALTMYAKEPVKATDHAACYDIHADLIGREIIFDECVVVDPSGGEKPALSIAPNQIAMIPTGLKMCCDPGFRIAMYPRSGLAAKKGLTLANCVGVVDADYRGEVMIPIANVGNQYRVIRHGERIAQIALERLEPTEIVHGLPETTSNRKGGFGSTGKE